MSDEITADVKDFFLEALIDKPVIFSAAKVVGVCPLAVQKAINEDEEFSNNVDLAMQVGLGAAEGELWERAVEGAKVPVFDKGKPVMVIDENGESVPLYAYKTSDKLLEFILKTRRSEVYGDKAQLEVTGQSVLIAPATQGLEGFRDMLNKHREGLSEEEG